MQEWRPGNSIARSTYSVEELPIQWLTVVAATAKANNLTVATLNYGDLPRIPRSRSRTGRPDPTSNFLCYQPCP